jgi:hypothetical protein
LPDAVFGTSIGLSTLLERSGREQLMREYRHGGESL